MMQVPTPPASCQGSEFPDCEPKQAPDVDAAALMQSLDDLLERYLNLLDQHQRLQKETASQLSSGFLSLAQANYTCPPGRRYGADYYDDRMKATKRISVHLNPDTRTNVDQTDMKHVDSPTGAEIPGHIFSIKESEPQMGEDVKTPRRKSNEKLPKVEDPALESNNIPETADSTTILDATSDSEGKECVAESESSKPKPRSTDPLRWYGILVPPSLRGAQKSFTDAIEGYIPNLASVVVEMRTVEIEISHIRDQLRQA